MCRIAYKDEKGNLQFKEANDELVMRVEESRKNNPALKEGERITIRASFRRYGVLMYANIKG